MTLMAIFKATRAIIIRQLLFQQLQIPVHLPHPKVCPIVLLQVKVSKLGIIWRRRMKKEMERRMSRRKERNSHMMKQRMKKNKRRLSWGLMGSYYILINITQGLALSQSHQLCPILLLFNLYNMTHWIVDFGALEHLCGNSFLFTSFIAMKRCNFIA